MKPAVYYQSLTVVVGAWLGAAAAVAAPITPRVINGGNAPTPHPWMVSLGFEGSSVSDGHYCGGVLVAPDTVVTAAHCVADFEADPSVIRATVNQLRLTESTGEQVAIAEIVIHPEYDPLTLGGDIALVVLERPLSGIPTIEPAVEAEVPDGSSAMLLGWGLTDPYYPIRPDYLQQATVPIQSDAVCEERLGLDYHADRMLCAGILSTSVTQLDGIDACSGDSGGPLLVQAGSRTVLAGITSWGFECGGSRVYGVYTRVSRYRDWILSRPMAIPQSRDLPLVSGLPMAGRKLHCDKGDWHSRGPARFSIEWIDVESGERLGRGANYKVGSADVGRKIACSVHAENEAGSRTLESEPLGPLFPAMDLQPVRGGRSGVISAGIVCRGGSCRLLIRTQRQVAEVRALIGGVWRRAVPMGRSAWQMKVQESAGSPRTAWIRGIKSGRSSVAAVDLS